MTNKMMTLIPAEMLKTRNQTETMDATEMIHGKEFQETETMNQEMNLAQMMSPSLNLNLTQNQTLDSSTLVHYGVLGMKWGIRKDRRKSGSSSSKKSSGESVTSKVSSAIKNASANYKKQKRINNLKKANKARQTQAKIDKKTNNPRKMSDAEIKKRIERLELEKKYKELSGAQVSKGKRIAEDILTNSVKNIGGQVTTLLLGEAVNKAFKTLMKDPNFQAVNPKKGQKDK